MTCFAILSGFWGRVCVFQTSDCLRFVSFSGVFLKWLFVILPPLTHLSRQPWKTLGLFSPLNPWIPCKQLAWWPDQAVQEGGPGPGEPLKINMGHKHPHVQGGGGRHKKAEGTF